ncbi:MAG: type II toxin-antitoxin system HicB family antitoxin [Flavisolibacter sp.]|nr:type II toxin-antitoxin system HicB family antitoxin [Flavisolibacter sp.]
MKLTIAIVKGEEYYMGTIKEIPGVITQGETIEETKENLMDALQLYLEAMESESELKNVVLEEDLTISYVS